jgi:hypothetical protein
MTVTILLALRYVQMDGLLGRADPRRHNAHFEAFMRPDATC